MTAINAQTPEWRSARTGPATDRGSVPYSCFSRRRLSWCWIPAITSETSAVVIMTRANARGPIAVRSGGVAFDLVLKELVYREAERDERGRGPDPRHHRALVREAGAINGEPGSGVERGCWVRHSRDLWTTARSAPVCGLGRSGVPRCASACGSWLTTAARRRAVWRASDMVEKSGPQHIPKAAACR